MKIELSPVSMVLRGKVVFEWHEIGHIRTEKLNSICLQLPGLELRNGKQIKTDISELEMSGKELLELIHQYVEAGKKNT